MSGRLVVPGTAASLSRSNVGTAALDRSLANLPDAEYNGVVEFRILGPLEVADGDRSIRPEAPKQRALLGLLLLHSNEVVSRERMIDELWGDRPPPSAGKVLQNYVSQLRRVVGADRISTRAPGYLLCAGEDEVDSWSFRLLAARARDLVAKGELEQADLLYRDALALWRGPPLADVIFESFARNEVERLAEEHLDVLVARIDCDLALGRHEQLVAELETLVAQYPLRERLRAQLMVALYRCGRQAEALAAYQEARGTLVNELGLEPGRELHDLERAILTHDPRLETPAPRPTDELPVVGAESARIPMRRTWSWRTLAGTALLVLAVAAGLAFVFDRGPPAPKLLAPESIGFVDARSGKLTRSFAIGGKPRALVAAYGSVWVANLRNGTVSRLDPATGRGPALAVGGHPSGLAAYRGAIWVWTLEGLLVRIDPRYASTGNPIRIAPSGGTPRSPGRITAGGGFLWVTVPETTVLRLDPNHPDRGVTVVQPEWGAGGPIVVHGGRAWVAGSGFTGYVFPVAAGATTSGSGIAVGGPVRDLTVLGGSLWVLSGGPAIQRTRPELRAVDLHDQIPRTQIPVGNDPVAIVDAAGSIWVASGTDERLYRVDPSTGDVVDKVQLGAPPAALAADSAGVWIAVS